MLLFSAENEAIFARPETPAMDNGSSCPAERLHVSTQIGVLDVAPLWKDVCALLGALELSH